MLLFSVRIERTPVWRNRESGEARFEKDNIDWCFEKKDGEWGIVPLRKIELAPVYTPEDGEERERRSANFARMYKETAERWKLDDPTVEHNEGFLRDHPAYKELFKKWAMRFLRRNGLDATLERSTPTMAICFDQTDAVPTLGS